MTLFPIYCAGGFSLEVRDSIDRMDTEAEFIYIDDNPRSGDQISFADFLLRHNNLPTLIASGDPVVRYEIRTKLARHNIPLKTHCDPFSLVSPSAHIADGAILMPFTSISSHAEIGGNTVVNFRSSIGHHTRVGDDCFISAHVNIGGGCTIGDQCLIGMGSLIKQGLTIGSGVKIGMGSVVFKDVPDGVTCFGNPARVYRSASK